MERNETIAARACEFKKEIVRSQTHHHHQNATQEWHIYAYAHGNDPVEEKLMLEKREERQFEEGWKCLIWGLREIRDS